MTSLLARGLRLDEDDHQADVPRAWTGFAQLLEEADFTTTGGQGIGYPTVVRVEGRLSTPIDNWYMYCSPHTPSTGIWLATAPEPSGPWTPYSSAPVISAMPTAHNDLSPPFCLYHPTDDNLWLWVGSKRTDNATQDTFLYKSTDGITFTIQNGGNPVLTGQGVTNNPADGYEAEYLTVVRDEDADRFVGMYQGINKASPDDVAHACMATSIDGVSWSRLSGPGFLFGATYAHAAWANDPGDDVENCGSFKPLVFRLETGLYAFYPYVHTSGSPAVQRCRRKLPGRGWTEPFDYGLGAGGVGAWDEDRRSATDLVYHDGSFWLFYGGGPSGAGEAIGVASCAFPQSGFDTTWGKG